MKKNRQRRKHQVLPFFLCFCMLFTLPGIQNVFPVVAAAEQEESFQRENIITEFYPLSEDVKEQTVFTGTDLDELKLPKELTVCLASGSFAQKEEESEQDSTEHENTGETDNIEKNVGTEIEDEQDILSDEKDLSDETTVATNEETDAEDEDKEGERASFEVQEERVPVLSSEESEGNETAQETHTVKMQVYHAENAIAVQTLKDTQTEEQEETVTIDGVTWQSEPEYNGSVEGTYTFTAVLPEGYALAEDVSLPQITVTVKESESGTDFAIQTLHDRIAALPDAEEYLALEPDMEEDEDAYAEWEEKLYEYVEEALAIWEKYDAMTEEQQTQISEEELAKLKAWVELAEQFSDHAVMLADNSEHHAGWTALSSSDKELTGGNYYLAGPVSMGTITIKGDVTLCLNGQTLTHSGDTGSVIVVESGTFTLCDCQDDYTYIWDGSKENPVYTLDGSGGCITGGKGYNSLGGGVYVKSNANFIMNSGRITECNVGTEQGHYGGGVYVEAGATFEMTGGFIENNSAGIGGGVYVCGSFIMSDEAVIMKNNADSAGGGVACEKETTTIIRGGKILGNTSGGMGGGVRCGGENSKLTMEEGLIEGNSAGSGGGGLHVPAQATLVLSGGTIRYNRMPAEASVSVDAGGVRISGKTSTLELSGSISIYDNYYKDGTISNVYLPNNASVTITGPLTNRVGITSQTKPPNGSGENGAVVVANENTSEDYDWHCIVSDKNYRVIKSGNQILLAEWTGNPVTITAYKDGLEWVENPPAYKLTSDNGTSFVTDLTAVPDGEYLVYDGDTDTGMTVKVDSAAAEVRMDYYTVTFYDGDTELPTPTQQIVLKGATAAVPTDNPTKTGYTFSKWVTEDNKEFNFSTTTISMATSVYASWLANTYTVSYDGNGSTGGSTANSTHTYGTAKALTANGFTRSCTVTFNLNYTGSNSTDKTAAYTFAGWNTKADGSGTSYDDNASVENLTETNNGTVTLYAQWTPTSVTYTPTRAGYTFAGWYAEASCTGSRADSDGTYTPTGDMTLYAKWAPESYHVTLNTNEGIGGTDITSYTCGTVTTLPTDWTRTGYDFAGWYDNKDCTGTAVTEISATDTGDKKFWAKWTPQTYQVTFHYHGADGGDTTASQNVTYNSKYGILPVPTRTGYTFKGWYTEADGKGTEVNAGTTVTTASAHTLHAYWKDEIAPDQPILQNGVTLPAGWTNNQTTIPLKLYDGVGVVSLLVSVDGSTYTEVSDFSGGTGSMTYDYPSVQEGEHTYQFKAVDAAGNFAESDPFTVKLDQTKPVIGTLTYDNAVHLNFWHWIIGKKSIVIHVPVTDAGSGVTEISYTMTPRDAAGNLDSRSAETKTATVTNGEAKITFDKDFRGTIAISCTDAAGNAADGVTVGKDAGGVIVEDQAPVITVQADRNISDAQQTQPGGVDVSEEYYNSAPTLIVTVKDDTDNAITAGIATVTYQFESGEVKPVSVNTGLQAEVSFTIPLSEIPTGSTRITIKTTDNAGNPAEKIIMIKVKGPEKQPDAEIDYREEKLTRLVPGERYIINGTEYTADQEGRIPVDGSWFGTTVNIVKKGNGNETTDSPAQSLPIPARPAAPAAPELSVRDDKSITLKTIIGAQYRLVDGTENWQDSTVFEGLNQKTIYTFKAYYPATDTSFASEESSPAQIATVPTAPTPDKLAVSYEKEIFTLHDGVEAFTDQSCTTPVTAGSVETYMGQTIYIRYPADGIIPESPTTPVPIPARPAKPAPGKADASYPGARDGAITGLEAGTAYEYRVKNQDGSFGTWQDAALNGTRIENLPAGEYEVRVKAVETGNAGFHSEAAAVTIGEKPGVKVTFVVDGEAYAIRFTGNGGNLTDIPSVPVKENAIGAWCMDEQGTTPAIFTNITADMTVYAVYTTVYTVTLQTGTGYTLSAQNGSTSPVKEGGSFTFRFALSNGYQKTADFAVKVNDVKVELTADNAYTISDIRENKTVTVEGVAKKPGGKPSNPGGGDKEDEPEPTPALPPSEPPDDTPSTPPVKPPAPGTTPPPAEKEPEGRKPGTTPKQEKDGEQEPEGTDGQRTDSTGAQTQAADSADAVQTTKEPQAEKKETQTGSGTVIVTVVCEEEKCTAVVADTEKIVKAVLTPDQQELVDSGGTVEIRIDVTDISDQVPEQDKEVIENGIEEYRKEVPGLALGMYVDISMFIRIGAGEWNAITETKEPIEIIIGIPEKMQSDGREFYIIRAHEGEYALMNDLDDVPDTITVSTDLFSSYAIAYVEADETGTDNGAKCGLCHICPTFLGLCYFVWLAIIILIVIVVIVLLRKKKEEQEAQDTR